MNNRAKRDLFRIILSAIGLTVVAITPTNGWIRFVLFFIPYILIGYDILWKALRNILHGQVFDENFLMVITTVGAFAIGEYPEAVFVMLFYQVGEWFQRLAVGKSRRSIASLMDIRPDYANLLRDGALCKVSPEEVAIGDLICVNPGEKIPLDGVITEGASSLSTSALTGESLPCDVSIGDEVVSGSVNISGVLTVRVSRPFTESTVVKILELVESATENKAKSEQFISKFARYYTPVVVLSAAVLAIIPPLFFNGDWAEWLHRALIFLVVSCPCALVISVPLTFFGGIGGASKKGILIKGANHLETLAKANTVVFDKTGTLTKGEFSIVSIDSPVLPAQELLSLAAAVEQFSSHPIAKAICNSAAIVPARDKVTHVEEVAGHGIKGMVDNQVICVGNRKLMQSCGFQPQEANRSTTQIHLCDDRQYLGVIHLSDTVKEGVNDTVSTLRGLGISQIVMLTGDRQEIASQVAEELQLDAYHAQLLPADKVAYMAELTKSNKRNTVVFVGDGMNDAPVLARSDVGIAMGGIGSDAAIEAADVVLMDDDPCKVPQAIGRSRRTLRIVRQNIAFALGVKLLVMMLAAFGHAFMWQAVFADVGVSVIAVFNAMRALT